MADNQELYVFWKYDVYPFILGAPLVRLLDNGHAVPEGYGGRSFKPKLIVPKKRGVQLHALLKGLELEYRDALRLLAQEWNERIPEELR
jgi:hypothetical protein